MPTPSYIYRRGSALYWRRIPPRSCCDLLNGRSWRFSLKAASLKAALPKVRILNTVADAIFTVLETLDMDPMSAHRREIAALCDRVMKAVVAYVVEDRGREIERARHLGGDEAEAARAGLAEEIAFLRAALQDAAHNPPASGNRYGEGVRNSGAGAAVAALNGVDAALGLNLDAYERDFPQLAEAALMGRLDAAQICLNRVNGDYSDEFDPLPAPTPSAPCDDLSETAEEGLQSKEAPWKAVTLDRSIDESAQSADSVASLADIIAGRERSVKEAAARVLSMRVSEAFADLRRRKYVDGGDWKPDTEKQIRVGVTLFIEIMGDRRLADITGADMNEFQRRLRLLPKKYDKSREYRDDSPSALVARMEALSESERGDVEFCSDATINKHLKSVGRLYRENGLEVYDPSVGRTVAEKRIKKAARDRRGMWEEADLKTWFRHPIYTGCKGPYRRWQKGDVIIRDALFWGPYIGALTGMRLGEISQLFVKDVYETDGVWCIDIEDDHGRRLKNEQSRRVVPVPRPLIDLGFIDHCEKMSRRSARELFPDIQGRGLDYCADVLGKRLATQRKHWAEHGFNPKLSFHGLRHTFTTVGLRTSGISREALDRLLGREISGVTGKVYFKGYELEHMKSTVDAVAKEVWKQIAR